MITQKREIEDGLERYGWRRIASPDATLDWWADEVWQLESVWQPQACRVFLTFVVDPQWSGPRAEGQGVWAIAASLDGPEQHGVARLILGRRWQERLPDFWAALAALRKAWEDRQTSCQSPTPLP